MTLARLSVALLVAVGATTAGAQGARGATDTVTVEYRALMTPEATQQDVRRRAIEGALAESVRRVAGVQLQSGTLLTKEERQGVVRDDFVSVVQLDARGRVVDYQVLDEEWVTSRHPELGAQVYFRVRVRAAVAREVGDADASFRVSIVLNSPALVVRSARATENDEMILSVTSSHDAALTLVSVADDSVTVLFPNEYVTEALVRAGEPITLPTDEWRRRGLRLRAYLPEGRSSRREVVMAIAVRGSTPSFRGMSVLELQRWLVAIPLGQRAVASAIVEVRRP